MSNNVEELIQPDHEPSSDGSHLRVSFSQYRPSLGTTVIADLPLEAHA